MRTNDNPFSKEKIRVESTVFLSNKSEPFYWKDIKHLNLEDNDMLRFEWVEPYYSENNSWDGHFIGEITRLIEETDEQHNVRLARNAKTKEELKKRRYENVLKLKAEFEPKTSEDAA